MNPDIPCFASLLPFLFSRTRRALYLIPRNKPPTLKDPKKWSTEFAAFIAICLCKDLEQRPTAKELLNNPLLKLINSKKCRLQLLDLIERYKHKKVGVYGSLEVSCLPTILSSCSRVLPLFIHVICLSTVRLLRQVDNEIAAEDPADVDATLGPDNETQSVHSAASTGGLAYEPAAKPSTADSAPAAAPTEPKAIVPKSNADINGNIAGLLTSQAAEDVMKQQERRVFKSQRAKRPVDEVLSNSRQDPNIIAGISVTKHAEAQNVHMPGFGQFSNPGISPSSDSFDFKLPELRTFKKTFSSGRSKNSVEGFFKALYLT